MEERVSGIRCYRFGPFLLDAHRGRLWRGDRAVVLPHKTLEVLGALVEDAGRAVSKDELLTRVWPDTIVEENNLARHVSTLRKALGHGRRPSEYILTISGHGYRFVADVEAVHRAPVEPVTVPAVVAIEPREQALPALAPPRPARASGWLSPASVGLSLIAGVGLVASVLVVTSQAPSAGADDAPGSLRRFTFDAGLQHQPTWSPDGTRVAFASHVSGNSDIWEQGVSSPVPVRLTTSDEHDWQPAWSPDGRSIAFRSERDGGGLYVIPAGGGPARRIASFGYRPRWSPSSTQILFSSSMFESPAPTIWVVGLDFSAPRRVRPDVIDGLSNVEVAWQPGAGDEVSAWADGPAGGSVFLTMPIDAPLPPREWTIPGDVARAFDDASVTAGPFAWAPSGRYLYFEGRAHDVVNLWRLPIDPDARRWTGGPQRMTVGAGDDRDFALSPDGRRIAFSARTQRTRLWSFPFDPAEGRLTGAGDALTSGGPGEYDAAAPRDGLRLAFRTSRAGYQQVRERSLEDGSERILISGPGRPRSGPRWSPDGSRLAYLRLDEPDEAAIGILESETGEERLLRLPDRMRVVPDDWSADQSTLLAACRSNGDRAFGVCAVDLDASSDVADVHVITADARHTLICPRFSPDERWISFMAVSTAVGVRNTSTLYVMPATGGAWIPLTEGTSYDDKPRWSPDGGTVYFISDREGPLNLWGRRVDPDTGAPSGPPFRVTQFDDPSMGVTTNLGRAEIAVSVDRVFLPMTETSGAIWTLDLAAE